VVCSGENNLLEKIFSAGIREAFLPFPLCNGIDFSRIYRDAMRRQWMTKDQLRLFQMRALNAIIKHSYEKVPYYNKLFKEKGLTPDDIKDPEDLHKIPILTKEAVKRNLTELVAVDLSRYRPILVHTGGSTGKAMDFYLTQESQTRETAFVERHWRWAGFAHKDRVVTIRGQILTEDLKALAPYKIVGNNLILSSFHLSEASLPIYARLVIDFKPKVFRLYPSALLILTNYFRKKEIGHVDSLRTIITSSETLAEEIRTDAERYWRVPIFDWYGLTEKAAAIGQCEHATYHVMEDYSYQELIPSPVPNQYSIVATTFYNLAMPLIRYETKDIVVIDRNNGEVNPCLCGRCFRTISRIDGRIEGIIVTHDRRFVGRLDAAFKYSPGIRLAQIIQYKPGMIQINMVKEDTFSDSDLIRLDRELRLRLGKEIEIKFEYVEDIPRTPTGKIRFVISKVNVC
jgi:phenylacetate-CoA ligase